MPVKKPRIDLRLLSYFHAVAVTGNITRASEDLAIAQPTLSKALRLLEQQMGATLLERHAHGVTLTAIGERLNRHAAVVLAQVGKAADEVEQLRTGETGEVRIGAGPSWVRRFLPQAVAAVLSEFKGIRVEVAGGFEGSLTERLTAGEFDFIVAELPLVHREGREVDRLTSDDLVVVGRRNHPLVSRAAVPASEALQMEWALPLQNNLACRKLNGRATTLGLAPPVPNIVSSSQSFLMAIAHMMDVLLYTTRSQLKSPEGQGLIELNVPELVTNREAGLIYTSPRLLSPAATLVANKIKEVCQRDPFN